MVGYCISVQPYFYELQASENTAQECNIQPYCLLTHQILYSGLFLWVEIFSIRPSELNFVVLNFVAQWVVT